jgi:hypothetical protein
MREMPIISTIGDACMVVSRWFGWADDLAGDQIVLPFEVPHAIETINHCFGRLWSDASGAHPGVDIFNAQDRLISPQRYEVTSDGIVPLIWENQGAWGCGFKPETGAQLWVTGDWPIDGCDRLTWSPTEDVIETALIFVMLSNSVWASADCEMDEQDERPDGADQLLWTFAPWEGFSGFWTNSNRTLIRMQGMAWGVTAHR